MINLTDKAAGALPPREGAYEVADAVVRGLTLRVQPSGARAWYYRYHAATGKQQRVRIGDAGAVSVTAARAAARKLAGKIATGVDPATEKRQARGTEEFGPFVSGQYSRDYLSRMRSGPAIAERITHLFKPWFRRALDDPRWLTDVEAWRSSRLAAGVSPSTVNRDVACLQSVFHRAVDWGLIADSPLRRMKALKLDRNRADTIRALTDPEIERLIAALDARDAAERDHIRPMILTLLNTGLRRGEVLGLEWRDLDLDGDVLGTLTVRGDMAKSGQTRVIPLNTTALETLRDWRDRRPCLESRYVFPDPRNGCRLDQIDYVWRGLTKSAQLPGVRLHDLRHTFATRLIAKGADVYTACKLLGHSSITVTEIYLHTNQDRMRDAVRNLEGL